MKTKWISSFNQQKKHPKKSIMEWLFISERVISQYAKFDKDLILNIITIYKYNLL